MGSLSILGHAMLNPLISGINWAYASKIIGYSPIAYWPLWEAGGSTAEDQSGNSYNGTYHDVALANAVGPDGDDVPYFDGSDDVVDIYSAGLNTAFDGAEGTIIGWAKVNATTRWTDGADRMCIQLWSDSANFLRASKEYRANRFYFHYVAGGTVENITITSFSPTTWFHWAMTWSKTANEVKAYLSGAQAGSTQTTLGTWATPGDLDSDATVIGARAIATPINEWWGWLAHIAVFDSALSGAAIADLAEV